MVPSSLAVTCLDDIVIFNATGTLLATIKEYYTTSHRLPVAATVVLNIRLVFFYYGVSRSSLVIRSHLSTFEILTRLSLRFFSA